MSEHPSFTRLAADDLTDAEQAHLAGCARCRSERRRVIDFVADRDEPAGPAAGSGALAVGTRVDRYVIEGVVGRGGMAVVYRARHTQLGSLHAIKVLSVASGAVRERLMAEGRTQATLRSRHVVPVTDILDVQGAPGLVMELVDGPTLADVLRGGERLTLQEVDQVARGILAGVACAHAAGIIHRDLKPGNVLLARTGEGWVARVTDFGLAKYLDVENEAGGPGDTRSGALLGTPAYMSPEQVRDARSVDARSDVFSLGAILYELLAGERAFPGVDVLAVLNAVSRAEPPSIRERAPGAPQRMVAAIEAALRVDPRDRPQDASALLALWGAEPEGALASYQPRARASSGWPGAAAVTAAVLGLAGAGAFGVKLVSAPDTPVVLLMDTAAPRGVYAPATAARGGTNADDLNDLLRDLPVDLHKEALTSTWDRERVVLDMHPDLVVVHRSAFFHSLNLEFAFGYPPFPDPTVESRWRTLYRTADDKLTAFLGLVGTADPDTRFLVYSRGSGDPEWPNEAHRRQWVKSEVEERFPRLAGRVDTMAIDGGVASGSFANPEVAAEARAHVAALLNVTLDAE